MAYTRNMPAAVLMSGDDWKSNLNPSRPLSLAKNKLLVVHFKQRSGMIWIAMDIHRHSRSSMIFAQRIFRTSHDQRDLVIVDRHWQQ